MKTILARTLLLAGAAILPAVAGNQILLRNFNSVDGVAWVFAAGGNGQLFVVSGPTSGVTRVVELDLTGTRLASLDLPLAMKWAASAQIQVMTPTGLLDGPTAPVTSIPVAAIFQSQSGLSAALNQDGSVNSFSNPAKSGSIVSVFATVATGNFGDGVVVPLGIHNTNMEAWAMDSERSLGVVFAGGAPGVVEGVLQINFLLPDQFPFGSLSGGYPGITSVFSFTVTVDGGSPVEGQIAVIQ